MNTILNDIFTSFFHRLSYLLCFNRTQQFYVHIEMGIEKIRLLWTVIFVLEMLIALIGNAMAIATFWKQRSTLKRTCYLLINLSVADLLIAIGEIVHLYNNIFYLKNSKPAIWDNILILPDAFAGSASLSFLTLISVERLYAIAWPFHHRTTNTIVYFHFIAAMWTLATGVTIIFLCSLVLEITSLIIPTLVSASLSGLCLVVILCSYLAIWRSKRNEVPVIPIDRRHQNKKLAVTLSIVTFLSVLTWLPLIVSLTIIAMLGMHGVPSWVYNIGRLLQLANSSINPIVYYARMPEFRKQLRNMFLRHKSHKQRGGRQLPNIPMGRNISTPVLLSFSTLNATI